MRKALSCLLLLLLAAGGARSSTEDELCRARRHQTESPAGAFQCPKRLDGADAKCSCQVFRPPSCCSSGEAVLGEQRGPRAAHLKEGVSAAGPGTTKPPNNRLFRNWWGAIVFFIVLAVGTVAWNVVRYCRERYSPQRRDLSLPNAFSGRIWLEDFGPPPPIQTLGVPPPYTASPPPPYAADPPPYSVEDPQDNRDPPPPFPNSPVVPFPCANGGSAEEGAAVWPAMQRNAPGCFLGPTLETELPVDS
ncbi:uncharacterized protein LOC133371238 [Rhineura floridana]|uniref:uncharacterized protein LOC133371238 n=1 Tax=Rhineura floridana TaxID=261503 RepID=UPI002AC7EC0B|nr:uncharacterized protein LOC133371238 [Rhineura floridana]XP_061454423.1 uncharacterized protein LOC133371238 [Rhineura floridana]XP_061454424.1 uncharacterized protein LOC133371238 [Rhineura floridana]XP_061454425.1 uncharacterized protein LOC133371238 [Rhineura floridana]